MSTCPDSAIGRGPRVTRANCRAPAYAILLMAAGCSRCGCGTHVALFWLPPGHDLLDEVTDEGCPAWTNSDESRLLHEVLWIDTAAQRLLSAWLPTLRRVAPAPDGGVRWVNHCEHCGTAVVPPDGDDGRGIAWLLNGNGWMNCSVMPVPEPIHAHALGWTIGCVADRVLDTIVDAAAAEAAQAVAIER